MNREIRSPAAVVRKETGGIVVDHVITAKLPLCVLVAFSSLFGFLLSPDYAHRGNATLLFFAVLFLACGAASLNSFQEHHADRLLRRTRERPTARGSLPASRALLQSRLLMVFGSLLLLFGFTGPWPAVAGMAAVIFYNFIYTPLKYKTVWALIPGAICGGLPPYIGWLGGQGAMITPVILSAVALLVVWQIPHFWLVVLAHKGDYLASNIPSLIKKLPERSLRFTLLVWIGALVTIVHVLLVLPLGLPDAFRWIISITSFAMLLIFCVQLGLYKNPGYRLLFMFLNLFIFIVMLLISVARVILPA